jgi:phenylalanine-4-hydroxylase
MIEKLKLSESGIPDMEQLSDRLAKLTGWRVVPVIELVPDDVFFNHLANRRFPAGAFIRSEAEMDYLQEPDIFHDVFGHVPLLANPIYADFMQAHGQGGNRALALGRLANLARLYWYSIEFGLIRAAARAAPQSAQQISKPPCPSPPFSLHRPERPRHQWRRVTVQQPLRSGMAASPG